MGLTGSGFPLLPLHRPPRQRCGGTHHEHAVGVRGVRRLREASDQVLGARWVVLVAGSSGVGIDPRCFPEVGNSDQLDRLHREGTTGARKGVWNELATMRSWARLFTGSDTGSKQVDRGLSRHELVGFEMQ